MRAAPTSRPPVASHPITKIPPKVERKTRKPATIDLDAGSPDAVEGVKPARAKRAPRAAANTDNVVKLPRASKGINLSPPSQRRRSKPAAPARCRLR